MKEGELIPIIKCPCGVDVAMDTGDPMARLYSLSPMNYSRFVCLGCKRSYRASIIHESDSSRLYVSAVETSKG